MVGKKVMTLHATTVKLNQFLHLFYKWNFKVNTIADFSLLTFQQIDFNLSHYVEIFYVKKSPLSFNEPTERFGLWSR